MSRPSSLNTLIRAGAGAGKTTRLIEEVYQFFSGYKVQNKTWPRIVLTTFSNKATQEINERLLKKAIQTNDRDFFEFINSKSHLLVSTIHGVLHLFISQNQSEFGLTKDFKIVDDVDISRRHQKIFRNLVNSVPEAIHLLEFYSLSELYSLVKDYRFFKLSHGPLRPYSENAFREFLITLSSEIKMGFQRAIGVLRSATLTKAWTGLLLTFPSLDGPDYILDLLRWEETIRLPSVPDKGESDVLIAQGQFVAAIKALRDFSDKGYHEPFLQNYSTAQTMFVQLADSFFSMTEDDRKLTQEMAISDIETLCFQKQLSGAKLFEAFSSQWEFWMIDEFQDTSPTQIALLNLLIGKARAFFVGDPQQSIYYFRGSDSHVFENKFNELSIDGHVEVLSNNYRSHAGVLSFVNEFFTHQYSQFKAMTVVKPSLNLDSDVTVYEMADKNHTARQTANQIKSIIESDPKTALEDIVVLSRTNRDLDSLARELEAIGVPHYVHSQGQFFRQREILDLLFFVRFLIEPNTISNLSFLLKTPTLGLSNDDTKHVLTGFKNWASLAAVHKGVDGKLSRTIERLDTYLEQSNRLGLVETTQIFAVNEAAFVLSHWSDSSGKKESNIWKLFYWLRNELSKGLSSFLVQLEAVLTPDKNEMMEESENQAIVEPDKIQMMTIHASKGLQFSQVIVIGLNNSPRSRSRFSLDVDPETKEFSVFVKNAAKEDKIHSPIHWQQMAIQKERESEEFERLLYVALTRAEKRISVFTLSKFTESSWSKRFADFFSHYQMTKAEAPFKILWIKLDEAPLESSLIEKEKYFSASPIEDNSGETVLKTFLNRADDLLKENDKSSPISFSSAKGTRQIDLHQILISQRGIGIHRLREKGIVDFSYYPKLDFTKDFLEIFAKGFKEYRFKFIYGQYQFVGSIDFVYFGQNRVLIVDYKSGMSTQNELYTEQLQFYAECLSFIKKMNSSTVFDLVIDYLDQKKIEHLVYKSMGPNQYFDQFLIARDLENIVSR